MTIAEFYKQIDLGKDIPVEVSEVLLEMDTIQSLTTQAQLNEMLMTLSKRIDANDVRLILKDNTTVENKEQLINWVKTNFTNYSANLFLSTI